MYLKVRHFGYAAVTAAILLACSSASMRAQAVGSISAVTMAKAGPELVTTLPDRPRTIGTTTNKALTPSNPGPTAAKNTPMVAGSAGRGLDTIRTASDDPTAIYRIGVDDVLTVEISNVAAPPKTTRVLADGTIDFPLAGEGLVVAGKTPREAASMLAGAIKLVQNPRVTLRVRGYQSHTVTICGLVDVPGEVQIPRDAVPFFVIRAGTNIDSRAKFVRIGRAKSSRNEDFAIGDPKLASTLIYPGDSVEFIGTPE